MTRTRGRLVAHVLLVIGVLISMFPFYWMVVIATNSSATIFAFPPRLVPGDRLGANLRTVFATTDFGDAFLNTAVVAVTTTVLVLFFDSLAAFAFAKFDFPGKRALFVVLLVTVLIPAQLALVPQFVIMAHLGWVGSLKALIVPGMVNAFGIFWMRQYSEGAVHSELLESGRLDGCSFFSLYWHVALPVLRPALAFLGIFTFIGAWNDFVWPLVVLTDPHRYTLQVALSQLSGLYVSDYSVIMAGTLLAVVPLLVVFLFGARHFIRDLAAGSVKG